MKKILLSFLALLLGFGLTWAQHEVTIHGSITAPADLPSNTLTIYVGTAGDQPRELAQISLPATSYSFTANVYGGSSVYFNLGFSEGENKAWAIYPYQDEWRSQDYFFETSEGQKNRFWMTLADWNNPWATEPEGGWYDYTFDLKIVAKGGGGGEETPKATLVGRVDAGMQYGSPNCLTGVTVAISNSDYSASTTTQELNYDTYFSKLKCMYGYKFEDLALGTYTLTYSKEGYKSQTKEVTITEAGEMVAPPVTLEAKPVEYIFEGVLSYMNAEDELVKVEGATITAYDGDGENARVLGTTLTNAQGAWSITLECAQYATVYFDATHPNITVNSRATGSAVYQSGNSVTISCEEVTLPLLAPAGWKVKQLDSGENLRVEVSWTWPQALLDDYNTAPGVGIYRITDVKIFRAIQSGGLWSDGLVGKIQPAEYELPGTSFIDGMDTTKKLVVNKAFTYHMEISYSKPKTGNVEVPNDEFLTITLTAAPSKLDSVVLTLQVNDPLMGTVTGAGKYEKNDMVVVKAQANPGYRFVAWKEGDNTLATTAQYTVKLTENKTLTAVFEAKPVVLDSVLLSLDVNNPQWGSVQGAGKYAKGDEVTIKAVPNSGYTFKQWKSGNVLLSTKAQYTFVLNTDSTITAVFEREVVYRGMTNCSATQTQGGENPAVRLSWQWPDALIQDYVTADGNGLYEISMVAVKRQERDLSKPDGSNDGTNESIKMIRAQDYTVPGTSFVDNGGENYPLETGKTYTYSFEITYTKPNAKNITVKDNDHLTVTIAETVGPVEMVELTLVAEESSMGTVTGAGQYIKNDSASIIATPNAGYVFKAWKENGATISNTAACKIKMDRNRTLTAVFEDAPVVVPDSVTLTLEADAEKGTVTGAGKYEKGQSVTITATAKKGYKFESWRENGSPVSNKATYTITSLMTDRTLKAVFVVSVDSATLTLETDGNGTVQGAGKYAVGQSVTIKATPNEGYAFVAWNTTQGLFSPLAEYTFTISRDITLTAAFAVKQDSATLTLSPNNSEMGYVSGSGRYPKGTEVTISATPRARHGFEAWKSGETVIATTRTHTILLNSDSVLTAVFYAYPDSVELTLLVNNEAMGTVQGAGRYPKDSTVTARAIPNEGYAFKAWKANDVNVYRNAEYTFKLSENLTLTAEFVAVAVADDSVTLTLSPNDDKMGTVQGSGKYAKGTEVPIKAVPNDGYVFRVWMEGETVVSETAEHKVVLDADRNFTAVFAKSDVPDVPKDSVTLSLSPNDDKMGTVQGAGKYAKGTEVPIKAVPNDGYVFRVWMEGETVVSETAEHKVVLDADRNLTAVFAKSDEPEPVKDSVTLTLKVSEAGAGTVTGAGKYAKGTEVPINAEANTGYLFVAWINGADVVSKTAEHKIVLNSDITLTALFMKETSNEGLEQADWNVYVENQTMVLQSKAACQYEVYNMAGVLVKQAKVQGEYRIAVNNSGLYIVRRLSSTGYSVKKVVVR